MATKTDLYIPQQQVRTVWFMREGDDSDQPDLSVTLRADLTNDELATITWSGADEDGKPALPSIEDVRDRVAPFVVDWNVGELRNGKPVKADPPAKAGGEALDAIADAYTWRILNELKIHNVGLVKASFLPKSKRSAPLTPVGSDTEPATSVEA